MPAISLTRIIPMTARPRSKSSETRRCDCAGSVLAGGIASTPSICAAHVADAAAVRQVLPHFPHHHARALRARQLRLALQRRKSVIGDVAAPGAAPADDI